MTNWRACPILSSRVSTFVNFKAPKERRVELTQSSFAFVARSQEEFAALFLPSLFRTLLYSFSNPYDFDARCFFFVSLAKGCIISPSYTRFVREPSDQARTWVSRAITIVAEFPDYGWDLRSYLLYSFPRTTLEMS